VIHMTPIPAVVVAAHRLVNQYHVIVRIGVANYRGSFATLAFGKTNRSSVLVTTVGLISFTFSIPDFNQDNNFRSGRFSSALSPFFPASGRRDNLNRSRSAMLCFAFLPAERTPRGPSRQEPA
jgi:hypothetical protein